MPPRIKITKDSILDAAFMVTREKGIQHVNARELARQLNCSTQPIFRAYESMEDLKLNLYQKVEAYYNQFMFQGLEHPIPFLGMGLAYIRFARLERNFFILLFMAEQFKIKSFSEMLEGEDNQQVIGIIQGMTGLSEEFAKVLFVDIWLMIHGIASMAATNSCDLDEAEIETILKDTFAGLLHRLKERDN
ncbi:TetR family transcriptional regulator [Anaerocolumna cellulosilytica]|uniref:TetR family transcriptional regulator n=1 Tax=Anaerocolumna cellulosilytica TaxID=433286 RepID=A0A6S6QP33_9FIRM|nr:TetR/AcrR family transcriptional regulator [Anaerocolumna cellulosilytica]MBB5197664.1 AcrR family transcriptional regulator [Anaerocolumna cellulosilytica]BCJ93113.1 TetR family transcriptional regulator [Anaerocolumna cellulosilytica]